MADITSDDSGSRRTSDVWKGDDLPEDSKRRSMNSATEIFSVPLKKLSQLSQFVSSSIDPRDDVVNSVLAAPCSTGKRRASDKRASAGSFAADSIRDKLEDPEEREGEVTVEKADDFDETIITTSRSKRSVRVTFPPQDPTMSDVLSLTRGDTIFRDDVSDKEHIELELASIKNMMLTILQQTSASKESVSETVSRDDDSKRLSLPPGPRSTRLLSNEEPISHDDLTELVEELGLTVELPSSCALD